MSGPQRRPFAAGDDVTRYPTGSPHALRIDSPFEKPGWRARQPGDQIRAPFPGTAIRFEGRDFEIVQIERTPGASPRFCYDLNPWDSRFVIRQIQEYTPEACEKMLVEHRKRLASQRQAGLLKLLGPLVGFLPAEDQKRFENFYAIPAVRNTMLSAVLLGIPASGLSVLSVALNFGAVVGAQASDLAWVERYQLIFWYFFLESVARFGGAFAQREPIGSLPVVLPVEIVRNLARAMRPENRKTLKERQAAKQPVAQDLSEAHDDVRELGGEEPGLEILSLLPKPHWTLNQTGIRYGETWYLFVDRGTVEKDGQTRYRFVLKPITEGMGFRYGLDYSPDEVQKLDREARRLAKRTWVETFAPLWGFLDAETQERLRLVYDFQPLKFTLWSLVLAVVVALAGIFPAGAALSTQTGSPLDLLVFVFCLYLLGESFLRWQKWSAGKPSGGLLGYFLKPFARRLLD